MEGEVLIGTIGKGGIFCEMAMVDDQPRLSAVGAKDKTTVPTINREILTKKQSYSNPLVRGLLRNFCQNIRSTMARRLEY